MRSDIVPGAVFPDYELSDHTAKHRKLSELQGQHPMVLVLSRGGYCPKDRRQAEGLVQLHREMEVGYCRLVTISTDSIVETNEFRSGVGAHWPFLSDPRRTVQKDLDIAEYTDPVHNPMIPHTIVLEPGLVVHKVYNGYWFFGRPTTEDLRQDLRAVTRKCRPDWDITTPEFKAAWEQGHKERFYPYGKTYAETIGEQDRAGINHLDCRRLSTEFSPPRSAASPVSCSLLFRDGIEEHGARPQTARMCVEIVPSAANSI
jgi:peroxiredoxin